MATDDSKKQPSGGLAPEVDVARLMEEIRARVKADVETNRDRRRDFKPAPAGQENGRKAGEIVHSEELYYLNSNYAYARLNLDSIKTHRTSVLGRLIVKSKRKLLTIREVSQLLRIHRPKVYDLIREGTIEGFKLGSDWRIKRESIEKLIGEIPAEFFRQGKAKAVEVEEEKQALQAN